MHGADLMEAVFHALISVVVIPLLAYMTFLIVRR
jgi:hypothetical protein